MGFSGGSDSNQSACNARDLASIPELGRSSGGGRHGNPLQYSCLKNPHGQRSLAGYSPRGRKQSDMTEQLSHSTRRAVKCFFLSLWFQPSLPEKKTKLILSHQDIPNSKPTALCRGVHQNQLRTFPKNENNKKKPCLISNSKHMNQKLQQWVGLRNVDYNMLSLQIRTCSSHCNYQPSPFNQWHLHKLYT